jgi:hypothetical protein
MNTTTPLNYLNLSVNDVERMRIDNSGNVAIGKTTPAYRLDVSGGDINLANGYKFRLNGQLLKPVEWDFTGSTKATVTSVDNVQWDLSNDSLSLDMTFDWELDLTFRNYDATTDYIGILYNGQTAGNQPTITNYAGHEFKQWGATSAVQQFVSNHCFSKVFGRNIVNNYNEHIYRLRLYWDNRNNALVNYSQGLCYRWANGTSSGATDYTNDFGVQIYSNASVLQEVSGVPPTITSIRFQTYTSNILIFRNATLRAKRVSKR